MDQNFEEYNVKTEMSLEELKIRKAMLEEMNKNSLNGIKKLNDILMERLERKPSYPAVTERTKKLHDLILHLSKLITEKIELTKSIESRHEVLKNLYLENREKYMSVVKNDQDIPEEFENDFKQVQYERDKALGLVKILVATLKSSRIQSEENFHKLKHSSDLMFHIMYKAEDAFLGEEDHESYVNN